MNLYQLIKALAESDPMYTSLNMLGHWQCMFCNPVQGNHEPECPCIYAKQMLLALSDLLPPELCSDEEKEEKEGKEQTVDRESTEL